MLDILVRLAVFALVFVAILGSLALISLRVKLAARGRRLREERRAECRREWDAYNPGTAREHVLPMPTPNADGTVPFGPGGVYADWIHSSPTGPVDPATIEGFDILPFPKPRPFVFNPRTPIE